MCKCLSFSCFTSLYIRNYSQSMRFLRHMFRPTRTLDTLLPPFDLNIQPSRSRNPFPSRAPQYMNIQKTTMRRNLFSLGHFLNFLYQLTLNRLMIVVCYTHTHTHTHTQTHIYIYIPLGLSIKSLHFALTVYLCVLYNSLNKN